MRPTVAPGGAPPWWLDDAFAAEGGRIDAQPLGEDVTADVAIVGGGYTGLWTALAVLERDPSADVVVLEAEFCGAGPSGRNGGFVEGYWPALAELVELFGTERAELLATAGEGIRPAIRALGEDVWLREAGMLMVATTPAQERVLDHALAAAAAGRPEQAVALTREEVGERCRSPRFRRGVLFPDTGTVHPGRLVRALRRTALARGVRLYEGTPARAYARGRVTTPGGHVRAEQIVVATNAAMTDWRPVHGRLTVFGSYVVLTEPVPELLAEIGWTGGEAIVDARMFLHYFRTTEDGRVLMGSGSGPIGYANRIDRRFTHDAPTAARAELGLRRLLPGLAAARIERSWGGPIDVSADHIPFVGTAPDGGIHFAAGFSGNGVGPSYLAGQALASLATGRDDEWRALPLVRARGDRVPGEPLRYAGGTAVRQAILACEEADEAGLRPPLPARAVAALPRLLGMRLGTR
ncbi:MAG TPA: FAD-dependent oxidoreductase [Gaiellaceae bacterium]|jgi:glycine/D-amino acid oxidase-like deaminating enzyme